MLLVIVTAGHGNAPPKVTPLVARLSVLPLTVPDTVAVQFVAGTDWKASIRSETVTGVLGTICALAPLAAKTRPEAARTAIIEFFIVISPYLVNPDYFGSYFIHPPVD
jgi:hypothetical protein